MKEIQEAIEKLIEGRLILHEPRRKEFESELLHLLSLVAEQKQTPSPKKFNEILEEHSDLIDKKLSNDENKGRVKYRHKDYCETQQHAALHQILKNAMYRVLNDCLCPE